MSQTTFLNLAQRGLNVKAELCRLLNSRLLQYCVAKNNIETPDGKGALEKFDKEAKINIAAMNKYSSTLYKNFKEINLEAAQKGLELFSEHTAEAKNHPGNHPNIDRLIDILRTNNILRIETILR